MTCRNPICCEPAWGGVECYRRCCSGGAGSRGHLDNSIPPVSSSASVLLTRCQPQWPPPPPSTQRQAEASGPRSPLAAANRHLSVMPHCAHEPRLPGHVPGDQALSWHVGLPPAQEARGQSRCTRASWDFSLHACRPGRCMEMAALGAGVICQKAAQRSPCPTPMPAAREGHLPVPWPPHPRTCPGQERREAGEAPAWHPDSHQGWLQRGGSRGGDLLTCWGLGDRGDAWAAY